MSVGGRYVSLFLMTAGYNSTSLIYVWVSNSVPRPPSKRAVSFGIVNGTASIGTLYVK